MDAKEVKKVAEACRRVENLSAIKADERKYFVAIKVEIKRETLWFILYYSPNSKYFPRYSNIVEQARNEIKQNFGKTIDDTIFVVHAEHAYLTSKRTGRILADAAKMGVVPNLAALLSSQKNQ